MRGVKNKHEHILKNVLRPSRKNTKSLYGQARAHATAILCYFKAAIMWHSLRQAVPMLFLAWELFLYGSSMGVLL